MLADARDGLITARQSKSGLQMNSHARVPDSIMRRFGGFAESGVSPDVPKVGNLLEALECMATPGIVAAHYVIK